MFVRTLFCFIIFIDLQVRGFIGGHGELVTAFVFRDIGVSFYPNEFHAVFAARSMELWLLEDMFKTSSLAKSVFNAH